jgi:hypothetical protein
MGYKYKCKNGNYLVKIYDNNYRVRETEDNYYEPELPEIYNLIISSYNPYGYVEYADINKYEFLQNILLFSEINIYGFDLFYHPQLEELFKILNKKKCYIKIHIPQSNIDELQNMNCWIQDNNVNEIHIELQKISKDFLTKVENKDYIFCDINFCWFSFKQLCKIKELNLIFKGSFNYNLANKRYQRNKRDINKHIDYILENFDCVEFDNYCINQFNLKDKIPELKNNYLYSNDTLFSIVLDLNNNCYYKSFSSKTKFEIIDNLKDMFGKIKDL